MAVMGQNLILNMNDHGFRVVAYNRTQSKVEDFLKGPAANTDIVSATSVEDMVRQLKLPRKIMLMVQAGQAVDDMIDQIMPHLDAGDIIIDGGNSLFSDTSRRVGRAEEAGFLYIGAGISGGEEGARRGPSIMPGGSSKAWPHVREIFQSIAAKVDGQPCCQWVGAGGAGHYVKMVHNGIEYGDMQLISEAYQLMRDGLKLNNDQMSDVFSQWNKGDLESYLIEITSEILKYRDSDGTATIDTILDAAGQKGTGKWTVIEASTLGQPVTLVAEAVFARCLSSLKEERVVASSLLSGPKEFTQQDESFIHHVGRALYASKIVSYTQGFMLLSSAAKHYDWQLNFGEIALMWRGGCIIRSRFLGDIRTAFDEGATNLLASPYFIHAIDEANDSWRRVIAAAVTSGVPVPAMSAALSFYDGYRAERSAANLLQAQRDYFGAHTYERIDAPRGEFFHTNWTGAGGDVHASAYTI